MHGTAQRSPHSPAVHLARGAELAGARRSRKAGRGHSPTLSGRAQRPPKTQGPAYAGLARIIKRPPGIKSPAGRSLSGTAQGSRTGGGSRERTGDRVDQVPSEGSRGHGRGGARPLEPGTPHAWLDSRAPRSGEKTEPVPCAL